LAKLISSSSAFLSLLKCFIYLQLFLRFHLDLKHFIIGKFMLLIELIVSARCDLCAKITIGEKSAREAEGDARGVVGLGLRYFWSKCLSVIYPLYYPLYNVYIISFFRFSNPKSFILISFISIYLIIFLFLFFFLFRIITLNNCAY
jgi:hypothetical protein